MERFEQGSGRSDFEFRKACSDAEGRTDWKGQDFMQTDQLQYTALKTTATVAKELFGASPSDSKGRDANGHAGECPYVGENQLETGSAVLTNGVPLLSSPDVRG